MEEEVRLVPMGKDIEKQSKLAETDPLPRRPDTYWWPALAAIFFCCMPCAIVALITAYQAEDHYDAGDYLTSMKLSRRAKRWLVWSVLGQVIYMLFFTVIVVIYIALLSVGLQSMVDTENADSNSPF